MDLSVPVWPTRVRRDEARAAKARASLFHQALKRHAKDAGWRYANGGLFRQEGDWFASVLPSLLWERGATVMRFAKPMAVDLLFWKIVGLPENERLPLSFRANGAWVLRPPGHQAYVALEERDPGRLADAILGWSTDGPQCAAESTIEALLAELVDLGPRRDNFVALEICLHLLNGDDDRALALCHDRSVHESGGFTTGSQSFFDQAQDWIVSARRARITTV